MPHSRGEILTFPLTLPLLRRQGLSLSVFQLDTTQWGGEILTFPDTPTTQGLSLWCFNTVRWPYSLYVIVTFS